MMHHVVPTAAVCVAWLAMGGCSPGGDTLIGARDGGPWPTMNDAATEQASGAPSTYPTSTQLPVQDRYAERLAHYLTVDKEGDYSRRMFIDADGLSALRQGRDLPPETLVVMETWFGERQGTVYWRRSPGLESGVWHSGSFSPPSPSYEGTAADASCDGCHSEAQTMGFYTWPMLRRAVERDIAQRITCARSSFTPCPPAVYDGTQGVEDIVQR